VIFILASLYMCIVPIDVFMLRRCLAVRRGVEIVLKLFFVY